MPKNVAVAAAMGLVILAGFVLARTLPSGTNPTEKEPAARGEAEPPTDEPETRQSLVSAAAPESSKTPTPQQRKAQTLARETLNALEQLEACAQRWDEQVRPLLSNAHGTLLAGDPTLVNRFAILYGRVDTLQMRQTIDSLRATMQEFAALLEAVGDDTYAPSDQFLGGMQQTKETVDALLATCRDTHAEIEKLLSVAESRIPPHGQTTLKAAMTQQTSAPAPE